MDKYLPWLNHQLFHKSEIDKAISQHTAIHARNEHKHNEVDHSLKPGTLVKVLLDHMGQDNHVPGILIKFYGTIDSAEIEVAVHIHNDVYGVLKLQHAKDIRVCE